MTILTFNGRIVLSMDTFYSGYDIRPSKATTEETEGHDQGRSFAIGQLQRGSKNARCTCMHMPARLIRLRLSRRPTPCPPAARAASRRGAPQSDHAQRPVQPGTRYVRRTSGRARVPGVHRTAGASLRRRDRDARCVRGRRAFGAVASAWWSAWRGAPRRRARPRRPPPSRASRWA